MKIISFNTTDEVAINSQNISVTNDSVEGIFRESNSDFSCEALCTKVADFSCYIENSCWVLMMERLLIIFSFILILAIFVKVVNNLDVDDKVKYRYTSSLMDIANNLSTCSKCKGLSFCPYEITGLVKYAYVDDNIIKFAYKKCPYKEKNDLDNESSA